MTTSWEMEMHSREEEEEFLPSFDKTDESHSSPAPKRELKRLRKANSKKAPIDLPALVPSKADEPPLLNAADSPNFDRGKNDWGGLEEPDARSGSQLEGFREGNELGAGLGGEEALNFYSVVENFHGGDGDRSYDQEADEAREYFGMDEGSGEEQSDLDGFDQGKDKAKNNKRGKRGKRASDGFHKEEPYSTASNKRMKAKERRDCLKQLRAESQRLLRETRGASFKPAPFVQKPISTVLEKIRKRKLEVSKRLITINRSSLFDYNGASEFDFESAHAEETETDYLEIIKRPVGIDSTSNSPIVDRFEGSTDHTRKNITSEKFQASAEESEIKFQAPVDDTQDLIFDSQGCDSKDLSDETPSSPLEEVLAPSLLAMNLKFDSAPPDESSDEEDNDKENINPHLHGSVDSPSSPKVDPVKAFVDEEAEEEDDSDNDLGRFQDDEEGEDNIDSEELKEMIVTECEEKPIDNEMRNQLHQKWLEQQDAAGTYHLLQRLKCSSKQREPSLLDERSDDEREEDQGELLDATMESPFPRSVVRMNLKKAKEMICQMFTDKDDIYLSSDDEVAEERHLRQCLSDKPEDQDTFLSPGDDEGSKEIFSLIKKLNVVPDTRRKAKTTSHFHMLSVGGSRTTSSKSSFLARGSKNSLPSHNKHVSSTVRSFVFERDDSRSTISVSEECSDSIHIERGRTKIASAKFCKTPIGSRAQNTQTGAAVNSGPSLHEILRCPSLQSSHWNRDVMAGKVDAIYAAFKLDKNIVETKERT